MFSYRVTLEMLLNISYEVFKLLLLEVLSRISSCISEEFVKVYHYALHQVISCTLSETLEDFFFSGFSPRVIVSMINLEIKIMMDLETLKACFGETFKRFVSVKTPGNPPRLDSGILFQIL